MTATEPSVEVVRVTRPPSGEYLIALLTKFVMTCAIRVGSHSATTASLGSTHTSSCFGETCR